MSVSPLVIQFKSVGIFSLCYSFAFIGYCKRELSDFTSVLTVLWTPLHPFAIPTPTVLSRCVDCVVDPSPWCCDRIARSGRKSASVLGWTISIDCASCLRPYVEAFKAWHLCVMGLVGLASLGSRAQHTSTHTSHLALCNSLKGCSFWVRVQCLSLVGGMGSRACVAFPATSFYLGRFLGLYAVLSYCQKVWPSLSTSFAAVLRAFAPGAYACLNSCGLSPPFSCIFVVANHLTPDAPQHRISPSPLLPNRSASVPRVGPLNITPVPPSSPASACFD